jgi:D-alanyl-D-alanine dipeptidase
LYPPGTPALVRASVAKRLVVAQEYLRKKGYGLKIWDAYRPQSAQEQLWRLTQNRSFVADPKEGRGMHVRGAAIDATLVDAEGRDVPMPTDFDSFTEAALLEYKGRDPIVRANLKLLQKAMAHGGFYGLRTEWWHFCAPDWKEYPPAPDLKVATQ